MTTTLAETKRVYGLPWTAKGVGTMPRLTVTDRAYESLLRYAQKELIRAELRERDRHWEVIISEELHVFLVGLRFENEPISQTLIRVLPMRTDARR